MTGLGADATLPNLTIGVSTLSSYKINKVSAPLVSTANPQLAPYGKMAYKMLAAMGELTYNASTVPTAPTAEPLPSWMVDPPYDNIDLTFAALGNILTAPPYATAGKVKSAFVSKAQICGKNAGTLGSYVWIAFTNSAYYLNQQAILLNNSDTHAVGLDSYVRAQKSGGTWNSFLDAHCYLHTNQ
jgi:ABC-type molybdate transport system substrate-binding protein